MMINYPKNLLYIIKKSKTKYIPKKIPETQKYFKLYHKYFCDDFLTTGYFKIIEIYNVNEIQYVTLYFSNGLYWTIPNMIYNRNIYELLYDKEDIIDKNIINSNESYFGYQILYWFRNKNGKKYSEFKPYIEGKLKIQETYKYYLYAEFKNNRYINIRFKMDKNNKSDKDK